MGESGNKMEDCEGRRNLELVLQLYKAFESRDQEQVLSLLGGDLEWWFHGPRAHQHMKRFLTGSEDDFKFCISSVKSLAPATVIVEGTDLIASVFWVHVWTISDGKITQVREYFNTSVTVTLIPGAAGKSGASNCLSVWKSQLTDRSLPGLVIPI